MKPRPDNFDASVSRSEERIRRLELRLLAGVEPPDENAPPPFVEPDAFVQWIQRGGANTTDTSWGHSFGPIARMAWALEQAGVLPVQEHLNRELLALRQAVGLVTDWGGISSVEGDVARAHGDPDYWEMLNGPEILSEGTESAPAHYFYTGGARGRIYRIAVPGTVLDGDHLDYVGLSYNPSTCASCFGLPCDPSLGCGDEQRFTFSEPQLLWSSADGPNWYECLHTRGLNCDDGVGQIRCHRCTGAATCCPTVGAGPCWCGGCPGDNPLIGMGGVPSLQTEKDFNIKWGEDAIGCIFPLFGGGREYPDESGTDQVLAWDNFWINAHLHDDTYLPCTVFCSGVVSNQDNVPAGWFFTVPVSRLRVGPASDATPAATYRPLVARLLSGALPGPITSPPVESWLTAEPWDEWKFDGHGDFGPGIGTGTIPDWFTLRDAIYAQIATGAYPNVEAAYAFALDAFAGSYTPDPGWREVPLCGSWEGRLEFRRVAGIVEWRGTVTTKHPVYAENVAIASFVPQEAMPPRIISPYGWVGSPSGDLLVDFRQEAISASLDGSLSGTGTIYVLPAVAAPLRLVGTDMVARTQTNPAGDHEEIVFDGLSYPGTDVPVRQSSWDAEPGFHWITTL